MYEHEGLHDMFFIMLYGGVAMMAVLAGLYLLLRRSNALAADVVSSRELRLWAAAFMASVAASHVWWAMLGTVWLTDDRLVRNIIAITLDRVTFVPLMMCVLLRMLQDCKRQLWPIAVAMVPFVVIAIISVTKHSNVFEWYIEIYSLLLALIFILYYIHALRQYGHWLHGNFADLEHKEVWQSLVLLVCILLAYVAYTTNEGAIATEYLAQILTLVIISFVVWRVETIQMLEVDETSEGTEMNDPITDLLREHCEQTQLYLQHDLTLAQLAIAIGTNRTYLGTYFAMRGENYNTYINNLRIDHFIRLYNNAMAQGHNLTAKELAIGCGYRSYSTFSVAFKQRMGQTVTQWMKGHDLPYA